MAIFIPRWERWKNKRPTGPVDVNWNNGLTQHLVEIILPGLKTTVVNNISPSGANQLPISTASPEIGQGVYVATETTGLGTTYAGNWAKINAPLTFFAVRCVRAHAFL